MDKYEFAQLLQSNKEKYYRIAYSYVKNEQDALDIVGEACLLSTMPSRLNGNRRTNRR